MTQTLIENTWDRRRATIAHWVWYQKILGLYQLGQSWIDHAPISLEIDEDLLSPLSAQKGLEYFFDDRAPEIFLEALQTQVLKSFQKCLEHVDKNNVPNETLYHRSWKWGRDQFNLISQSSSLTDRSSLVILFQALVQTPFLEIPKLLTSVVKRKTPLELAIIQNPLKNSDQNPLLISRVQMLIIEALKGFTYAYHPGVQINIDQNTMTWLWRKSSN